MNKILFALILQCAAAASHATCDTQCQVDAGLVAMTTDNHWELPAWNVAGGDAVVVFTSRAHPSAPAAIYRFKMPVANGNVVRVDGFTLDKTNICNATMRLSIGAQVATLPIENLGCVSTPVQL